MAEHRDLTSESGQAFSQQLPADGGCCGARGSNAALLWRAKLAGGAGRVRVTVPERDWTCGGAYLAQVAERLALQRPAFALRQ